MSALRRLAAIVVKEALQIVRDPSSIIIGFILPAFLTLLSGYATNLDIDSLPIGLVVQDSSPEARDLASAFRASRFFVPRTGHDTRQFEDDLVAGRVRGIVVIPATFSSDLARAADSSPVQIIADGSEPNTAAFLQNYAQGVWQSWMAVRAARTGGDPALPVTLVPRTWYNQELVSLNSLLPGGMAINLTLIGALLTALVVAREWERGTMEAMLATPVGRFEMLVGKLVPYFLLGMIAMFVCLGLTLFVFHVPFRGSLGALLVVSSVFMVSALSMGLFISSLARNQFVAAQAAILSAFLPSFFLSGYVFELAGMPLPIRLLSHLIAARYFVSCLKTIFLVGDAWAQMMPNMLGMGAIAAVFLALTIRNTARRIA